MQNKNMIKIFLDNEAIVLYHNTAQSLRNAMMRTVSLKDDFCKLRRNVVACRTAKSSQEIMLRIGDLFWFQCEMLRDRAGVRIAGKGRKRKAGDLGRRNSTMFYTTKIQSRL